MGITTADLVCAAVSDSNRRSVDSLATHVIGFCPFCCREMVFDGKARLLTCQTCCRTWAPAAASIVCPEPRCQKEFPLDDLPTDRRCPHCRREFDNAVPIPPVRPKLGLAGWLIPGRRAKLREGFEQADEHFRQLRDSWRDDSTGASAVRSEGQVGRGRQAQIIRHLELLETHRVDVEKYLYQVGNRLTRIQGEYSWRIREECRRQTDRLLDGILGPKYVRHSFGLLVRCPTLFPDGYSSDFLAEELESRLSRRYSEPRPGFQQTIDFVRTLNGEAFEAWLEHLLRSSGINSVWRTPATGDQGADLIVEMGHRRIAIQAKQYVDPVGNSAVQEVFAAQRFYGATEGWVISSSTFTPAAAELARRAGVHLVDGPRLLNLPQLLLGASVGAIACEKPRPDSAPGRTLVAVQEGEATEAPARSRESEPPGLENSPDWRLWASHGWLSRLPKRATSVFVVLAATAVLALSGALHVRSVGRQRGQIQGEVREVLAKWTRTIRSADPEGQIDCYGPQVAPYFRKPTASRTEVAADKARMMRVYSNVRKYEISRMNFESTTPVRVVVSLDKEWEFTGRETFAGKERQSLELQPSQGRWRITGEREVKLYWVFKNNKVAFQP